MTYRVVYSPFGHRHTLGVSFVYDYEKDSYAYASRKHFLTEDEAQLYAIDLAKKNGLKVDFEHEEAHDYLD